MASSLFRYVALGDSTAVGVGANNDGGYPERLYKRLKAAGVKVGIMNLAQSGATSADVIQWQLQRAINAAPQLVTLGIGSNDLLRLFSPEQFEINLRRIADGLVQTHAEVVVSNLIDLSALPVAPMLDMLRISRSLVAERVHAFNEVLTNVCAGRHRFHLINLHALGSRESSSFDQLFASDGFHPGPKGYERWADALWPTVHAIAGAWQPPVGFSGDDSRD